MPIEPLKAIVVGREDHTSDLFVLKLEPQMPSGEKFIFKPGQYCTIGIGGLWRPYSIVSAPHEEYIELFVEFVPRKHGGNLTPLLYELKIGDSVDLLPKAKGIFTFDPTYKNHVMVATVTGVVTYISILRDYIYRQESGHNFYILQGASYMDEFGYYDELFDLESTHPILDMTVIYAPTISRPDDERNLEWLHQETGRVNTLVEDFLRKTYLSPRNTLIYACGNPGMIEDVKRRLIPKGWTVKEERFWK